MIKNVVKSSGLTGPFEKEKVMSVYSLCRPLFSFEFFVFVDWKLFSLSIYRLF